ncbi:MAG: transporter substrate-binding domain-containing protein [Spirochaetota bacterium]
MTKRDRPGTGPRGLLVLAALLFSASAVAQSPSDPATITIAAEPDYPPYSYVDEAGAPTGFAVELFRAVARAVGLDVTITTGYWAEIRADLAAGRLDALPLVGRTPEREEIFDFTVPYLSLYGGIVVRDDDERFREFDDLDGRRVAVMAGDNAEEFLRRQETDYEIRTFPTFTDALEDVAAGRSDAVVMQRLVALRILREEGLSGLRLLDKPVDEFRQDFCFAVTEGDKELLATLNEGLSLVVADGTFRRLQTEWFAPMELPSRTIIVGGDHNYPPFEFIDDDGRPAGYNVDLARAVAREMGLDIEIRLGSWTEIRGMLERGEIDVLGGMMYSAARDRIFDFSPAHTVHQHVAIGRDRARREMPASPEELVGPVIAVQDGDIVHDFVVERGITDNLVVVDSQEEALELVRSGAVDYALGSRLTAMYLIEQNGWDELVVGQTSLVSTEYGFAVREGNTHLLSYFTEGLVVLEESGEYRRIYDRWLGVYAPAEERFARVGRVVLLVLAPLLLVLATIIAWNRSLRAQVARSTAELKRSAQRTQWLNSLATSYLVRKDASSLIRDAVEALEHHFPDVHARFLALDGQPGDGSPRIARSLGTSRLTRVGDALEIGVDPSLAQALRRDGARALAAAVVPVDGVPTGFLAFTATAPRAWTDHEIQTLEEHANLLTLILENETYQRLIEETNTSLATSLQEKETLLKEVHHRVKNNLNVIVSLLRLQEDQINSVESARDAFEQSRNRIFSMALVHQSLYQSDSLADIELDEYLRSLIHQLETVSPAHREIRYECDLEPVRIDVSNAVPCGIIINELVSNAQKHAFGDSRAGEVVVSLSRAGGSSLVLSVRDNGVGMPEHYTEGQPTTLGLKLVSLLAAQIDGTLTFARDGGTRVDLTFPAHTGAG